MDKKTFFIGWNYLMLAVAVLNIVLVALEVIKGSTSEIGALMFFTGLLAVLPAVLTIIMARAGIRGEYSTCRKIAFFVLAINIINVVFDGKKALISAIAAAVYFYLVLSLDKYKY
ncbi:hypothetical protein [uncultured Ruminococcus sp.]|uniref:hypothetical protein n=1 Tax=uncultured Ruminococcus sp. TaxID=165186 RepID=UPI00262739B2|nr:hypothetical protein [uncultured Ruminococcus sp.]